MSPGVILFVVLLGAMWFLLVRPQRRRQLEQRRKWETAGPGDEIVTAGGLYGTITRTVDESDVMLEIAPGIEVRVARRAIAGIFTHDDEAEEADELEPAAEADEEPTAPEPAQEQHG